MVKQRRVQNRKNRDLYEGFGIGKDELSRCVACPHVIDCNTRKKFVK